MKQITIKIKTLSSVVLSTRGNTNVMTATRDYFTGTMVRGILANRYIQLTGLDTNAHEDEDFLSLFFDDLRFVDAYPVNKITGTRSMVLPLSLQKIKDGTSIIDLLKQNSEPNYKSLRGFGSLSDEKIYTTEISKNISLHMSRSDMKKNDGEERLAGRSTQHGIYNYESIDAGQSFEGSIFGSQAALEKLSAALQDKTWLAHIGKSHYTQYGSCQIQLSEIQDIPQGNPCTGDTICLRLETPLLMDSLGADAAATLHRFAQQMNARCHTDKFHIVLGERKIFSKAENIDNFVGVWGMKRPRVTALAAGTIFLLQKDEAFTAEDYSTLTHLCYEGIGQHTAEGFGQVRVWNPAKLTLAEAEPPKAVERQAVKSQLIKQQALNIIEKKMFEAARIFAAEDVERAKNYFPKDYKHLFNRLDGMLGRNPAHSRSHLQESLLTELRGNTTPIVKLLHKVEIQKSSLFELLQNAPLADMPYNQRNWKDVLSANIVEALHDINEKTTLEKLKTDETLFYEYWHWFFRHGRKTQQAERWLNE